MKHWIQNGLRVNAVIKVPAYFCDQSVKETDHIYAHIRCPAGNYMFKVKNRNTRTRCEIRSKSTIKTLG